MSGGAGIPGLEISEEETWWLVQFQRIAKENGIALEKQSEPFRCHTGRIQKFRRKDQLQTLLKSLKATNKQTKRLLSEHDEKYPKIQLSACPLQHSVIASDEGKLYFVQYLSAHAPERGKFASFKLAMDLEGNIYGLKIQKQTSDSSQQMLENEEQILKLTHHLKSSLDRVDAQSARKKYMVIQLFSGPTVAKSRARLSPAEQETFFISLLANLKYLQDHQIIHGDLHAGNVIMNSQTKEVVFIDYGLSEVVGSVPNSDKSYAEDLQCVQLIISKKNFSLQGESKAIYEKMGQRNDCNEIMMRLSPEYREKVEQAYGRLLETISGAPQKTGYQYPAQAILTQPPAQSSIGALLKTWMRRMTSLATGAQPSVTLNTVASQHRAEQSDSIGPSQDIGLLTHAEKVSQAGQLSLVSEASQADAKPATPKNPR